MRLDRFKAAWIAATAVIVTALAVGVGASVIDDPDVGSTPTVAVDRRTAADQPGRALADELSLAFERAAQTVEPSVVAITSEREVSRGTVRGFGGSPFEGSPFGDLFRFFGTPDQRQSPWGAEPPSVPLRGLGSGVIVREDGYILTNNHVVDGATRVLVALSDERELEAEVVGRDPETDLAVLRVDADDLPAAQLADSEDVRVGQWVIAVGNPFELRHTVTAGIISATGRSTVGLATYEDFIQTDASINPGNSGGALADLDGRVIGINTAISSPSGGNVGIGFAIPVAMAKRVMEDLIDDGSIERGYLSLIPQDLDAHLAEALGLDDTRGALVADVTKEGPADRAGIESGDVIVRFGDHDVADSTHLRNLVAAAEPGSKVDVGLLRDGHSKSVTVKLGARPGVASMRGERGSQGGRDHFQSYGFEALDLTQELAEQTGYTGYQGVLVRRVDPTGPAARSGLRRGDLIQRVGREPVTSVSELESRLADAGDSGVALQVRRGQGSQYLVLPPLDSE